MNESNDPGGSTTMVDRNKYGQHFYKRGHARKHFSVTATDTRTNTNKQECCNLHLLGEEQYG